jgi:hypothetical protein
LLCAALPARAADETYLRPLIDVEQSWDSNIYNDSDDDEGSLVTTVSPALWFENQGEQGHARAGVTARARNVWRESDLSGIDVLMRGDFEHKLTPRLTLFGDGAFDQYSGYDEITEGSATTPGQPGNILLSEQPSWKRDHVGGGGSYLLTERLSLTAKAYAGRVNYESVDVGASTAGYYRDRTMLGGGTILAYQLTALDQLIFDVGLDDTDYQDIGGGTNDTAIWSTQVGWNRIWTQAWTSRAKIGFSVTDTQLDGAPLGGSYFGCIVNGQFVATCPVSLGTQDVDASSSALIGELALKRSYSRGAVELSYARDTRSTSGSGRTNFDIDSLTLSWTHRLAERVRLRLIANYSMYDSVTDEIPSYPALFSLSGGATPFCPSGGVAQRVGTTLPAVYQCVGGSSSETRDYASVIARLEWQLRRRLSSYLTATYRSSQTDQERGNFGSITTEDLDKYTIAAGFRWYHDLGL